MSKKSYNFNKDNNSYYLFSDYYVQGTVVSALYEVTHLSPCRWGRGSVNPTLQMRKLKERKVK